MPVLRYFQLFFSGPGFILLRRGSRLFNCSGFEDFKLTLAMIAELFGF